MTESNSGTADLLFLSNVVAMISTASTRTMARR